MLMRFNPEEISFVEFLWKLAATAMFIGLIGVFAASHAESDSDLQDFSYFVVGSCALVVVVSTILAVIVHIWTYKPRSRRPCVAQNQQ